MREHPELREDIEAILGDTNANLSELAYILAEDYGFVVNRASWNRWSLNFRLGQLKFDGNGRTRR